MAFDESLAERVRATLSSRKGIEEKKMFGGICFLLHGKMLVGVWKDSLIVRLGKELGEEACREPYVKPFDLQRKPMKGVAMVAPEGIEGEEQLSEWITRAVKYVSKLPAK